MGAQREHGEVLSEHYGTVQGRSRWEPEVASPRLGLSCPECFPAAKNFTGSWKDRKTPDQVQGLHNVTTSSHLAEGKFGVHR